MRWEISRAALAITAACPQLRPQACAQVMQAVHDGEPLNRQIGAEFLGRLGDPAAIRLWSRSRTMRPRWSAGPPAPRWARWAIPPATATLILRLADDDLWVRCSAAGALARIGARFAVPPLLQVSRDEQPVVRQAVVAALGAIGGPDAQAAVRRALRDHDPGVRLAAVRALERSGDQQAFKALGALGRDRAQVGEVRINRAAGAAPRPSARGIEAPDAAGLGNGAMQNTRVYPLIQKLSTILVYNCAKCAVRGPLCR